MCPAATESRALVPRARGELAGDRALLRARLANVPAHERKRIVATEREVVAGAAVDSRRDLAVPEAWLEPPAHRHAAGQAFHAPHELTQWRQPVVCERERVDDSHGPARGSVGRGEHVRVFLVAPLRLERLIGCELEGAATAAVEQAPEGRRRVEVGKAEPVRPSPITAYSRIGA